MKYNNAQIYNIHHKIHVVELRFGLVWFIIPCQKGELWGLTGSLQLVNNQLTICSLGKIILILVEKLCEGNVGQAVGWGGGGVGGALRELSGWILTCISW